MKKTRFLPLICPTAALILEALPWGAVLNFARPEGEPTRQTYSYFSLMPFGYANFWPLITAVLTCVLLITALVALIRPLPRLWRMGGNLSAVAAMTSVGSWVMFGFDYFTLVGGGITLALVAHTVLSAYTLKKRR